jgi:uncharacterized protein YcbK (DUF882 family)
MGKLSANFDRSEFACKCLCDYDTVDVELLEILEAIRQHFAAAITINSAARCPNKNRAVGGAKNSQHLYGRAADIVVDGIGPDEVHAYIDKTWPNELGLGRYATFTHVDSRGYKARWES